MLIRYCDDQFDSESSTATIGVDFKVCFRTHIYTPLESTLLTPPAAKQRKKLSVHGKAYQLYLLDTAGQERFRTLSNSYYRGAHGVILVYDISDRQSFVAMERWFDEAENNAIPGAMMYLVGSKLDRAASRAVQHAEGEQLAARHGAGFCEVSSKTRENVRRPFVEIVDRIVKSPQLLAATSRQAGGVALGPSGEAASGCYC